MSVVFGRVHHFRECTPTGPVQKHLMFYIPSCSRQREVVPMCEKGYEGPGPLGTDFEVRDLYGFVLAFFRGLRDNLSCCKRTPGNICLNSACKCSQPGLPCQVVLGSVIFTSEGIAKPLHSAQRRTRCRVQGVGHLGCFSSWTESFWQCFRFSRSSGTKAFITLPRSSELCLSS